MRFGRWCDVGFSALLTVALAPALSSAQEVPTSSVASLRRGSPDTGQTVPRPQLVAFTHVSVIPMDHPGTLEDQTVIVRDGRIARIGPASEITVPDGATGIDGRGRYLLPGLADMHMHLTTPGALLLYLANGVTTVRNMAGRTAHLAWRDSVAHGELLGPTIYTAGPIVDGPNPIWPGSASVVTASDADSIVGAQRAAGYDFVKVYGGLSLEAYRAVMGAARHAGMPVVGHLPNAVPLDTALAAGQASIEHLTGYAARVTPDDPVVAIDWRALSTEEIRVTQTSLGTALLAGTLSTDDFIDAARLSDIARTTRAGRVWNTPTLVLFERPILAGTKLAEALAAPEMKYVLPAVRAYWPSMDARPDDLTAPVMRYREAQLQVGQRIVLALHRAGAQILMGTDAPNPLIIPGFAVQRELRHLVDAGLTPFQALETATRNAAEFLDAADTFGTVRVGMRADLLLLDANPLADIGNVARRVGVMVRGRWLTEAQLFSALDRLAESYAR